MRYALFLLLVTSLTAAPEERHGVVFDLLYPGVRGITMRGGVIEQWPAEAGPQPTPAEMDAAIVSWRRFRNRRDKREALLAKYREILQLQALRSEDPSVVTTEDIARERARAVRIKEDLDALPAPVITPAPTPTPEP